MYVKVKHYHYNIYKNIKKIRTSAIPSCSYYFYTVETPAQCKYVTMTTTTTTTNVQTIVQYNTHNFFPYLPFSCLSFPKHTHTHPYTHNMKHTTKSFIFYTFFLCLVCVHTKQVTCRALLLYILYISIRKGHTKVHTICATEKIFR